MFAEQTQELFLNTNLTALFPFEKPFNGSLQASCFCCCLSLFWDKSCYKALLASNSQSSCIGLSAGKMTGSLSWMPLQHVNSAYCWNFISCCFSVLWLLLGHTCDFPKYVMYTYRIYSLGSLFISSLWSSSRINSFLFMWSFVTFIFIYESMKCIQSYLF